ncbi:MULTISPECIES: hypothetical protein [unclassified Bartonella]
MKLATNLATNKELINSWFAEDVKSYNRRIPESLKDFMRIGKIR